MNKNLRHKLNLAQILEVKQFSLLKKINIF